MMLLLVLTLTTTALFAESVADMNGNDWIGLTNDQQVFLVAGTMLGSAMNNDVVSTIYEDMPTEQANMLLSLNDMRVQVQYVVDEVNAWYNETRDWETEIYYVIYGAIGNLDEFINYVESRENSGKTL